MAGKKSKQSTKAGKKSNQSTKMDKNSLLGSAEQVQMVCSLSGFIIPGTEALTDSTFCSAKSDLDSGKFQPPEGSVIRFPPGAKYEISMCFSFCSLRGIHWDSQESETEFFEVKDAGIKGLGVFATTDIPAGTLILAEDPIFIIKGHVDSIKVADVFEVYNTLSTDARMKFARLRSALDYLDRFKRLDFDMNNLPPLEWVWITYYSNKHSINDGKAGEKRTAVYHICSLFNHSCLPNTWIAEVDGRGECRVFHDIKKGEEITFGYNVAAQFMTTSQRALNFKELGLPLPCHCQLCSRPASERIVSDMRRCLLRHLYIFVHAGEDLDVPHKLDLARSVVNAPRVTKEGLLARHTLYLFLFAKLAEAEGVIDFPYTYVCLGWHEPRCTCEMSTDCVLTLARDRTLRQHSY